MLGLRLRSASSEDPSMDAPEHVPLCDPFYRRTIRKQRNSCCGKTACRICIRCGNRVDCLFPASCDRRDGFLHPRQIPCPLPAGSVESAVGRAEVGRIGGIRTAENPLLSAYRMDSSM